MNRTIPSLLLAATASFAAVPVAFTSGTPAKADDVNKNFASLDSAIQKKADASAVSVLQSAVSTKADQTKLDDLTKTVATKASQSDLSAKKDSAWIVSAINGKLPTGTLSAKNNLSELKDSAAQVRTNLGLKSLATSDNVAWSSVSKSGAKASDLGAFDSATIKSRFLPSNGVATLGGDFIIGNNPIRRAATEWLLGVGDNQLKIGSEVINRDISIWNGTKDTTAIFAQDHVTLGRPLWLGRKGEAAAINFLRAADGAAAAFIGYDANDATMVYKAVGGSGSHDWWTNPGQPGVPAAKTMRLDQNGNLNVSGTITASVVLSSAIKASDVADYVFEPDYKLAPLSEVEAFTKANKHLPEVPSAAEIEKNGLDLAKMNLLLLKKVEELTLHTIELEKRLKAVEVSTKP